MPAELQPVDQVRVLVDATALLAIHAGRIAVWVLLASASMLVLLRAALLAGTARGGRPAAGEAWGPGRLTRWAATAAAVGALTLYQARRPDTAFLVGRGQAALEAGHYQEAQAYFEPLARWGTDRAEVYDALAVCHLKLGRPRAAIEALKSADALAPGRPERHVAWAYSLVMAGEPERALAQLAEAARLARSPQQRAGIETERDRLLARIRGGRTTPP